MSYVCKITVYHYKLLWPILALFGSAPKEAFVWQPKDTFTRLPNPLSWYPLDWVEINLTENGKNIFKPWQWTEYNGGALHRIPSKPCKGVMDAKTKKRRRTWVNFLARHEIRTNNYILLKFPKETNTRGSKTLTPFTPFHTNLDYTNNPNFHYTTGTLSYSRWIALEEKSTNPNNRLYSKHTLEYTVSYCTAINKLILHPLPSCITVLVISLFVIL